MKLRILSNGDDWEGLYVDGALAIEGHRIRIEDVLGFIPDLEFKKTFIDGYFEEWGGSCPEKWLPEFEEKAE